MSSAFTKSYLMELIDGRIEAIGSAPGINTNDEKLLQEMRRENVIFEGEQLVPLALREADRLASLLDQWEQGDNSVDLLRQIDASNRVVGDLSRQTRPKHDYQATSAVEDRIRKERRAGSGTNPKAELARLERVKKYLTDAPAEEFSLTLMQRLGFIDIIKTAINS